MATFAGKDGAVFIASTAVAEVRDFSVEQTANRVDDTVMGDEWMTGKVTQKSWTGSANIYYDPNQTGIELGALVTLNLYPQGNTTGLQYYTGQAHITGITTSQSFDGMIEGSISFDGDGELSIATA